jgi:hypothetical protein
MLCEQLVQKAASLLMEKEDLKQVGCSIQVKLIFWFLHASAMVDLWNWIFSG